MACGEGYRSKKGILALKPLLEIYMYYSRSRESYDVNYPWRFLSRRLSKGPIFETKRTMLMPYLAAGG